MRIPCDSRYHAADRTLSLALWVGVSPMRARSILPVIFGASAALSLVRVVVLFSESWAAVRAERVGDAALLQICDEQTLSTSEKFRNACLQARADTAAPVLLKTLMRSVHTAFVDFSEAFNTPTRLFFLILFLLSGVSAPLVRVFVTTLLRGAAAQDDGYDADPETTRIIFVGSSDAHEKKSTWAQLRQRVRRRHTPTIEEVHSEDDLFHECGQGRKEGSGWAPLDLVHGGRSRHVGSKHL
jgi:hypothetical protein